MKYKVTLNDKTYEVEVEKGQAILAAEYAANAPAAAPAPVAAAPVAAAPAAPAAAPLSAGETVRSPLPGTVVNMKVSAGQAVKAGDIAVIIEAMKMENEVLVPTDGTVAQIVAQKGAIVKTGDPLFVLA